MTARKVACKVTGRSGEPVTVYGQITADGAQVSAWTASQQIGLYNIERFPDGRVTGATLRAVLTGDA